MDLDPAQRADVLKMRARWKYVCYVDGDGDEVLETFDPSIIHAQYVQNEGIARGRLVSAGFATIHGECYGHSTSLGISSRPQQDTAMLREQMG